MDKEQVKKVLEKKQKEVERFAYDIKNWSIPLFDREFIKALQYAIEAIEEKDRLKELTKPENCKHFSSGHCNIADNSVGRTDCNVGGCPDFEAKLKKAEETITHGIEELVKVTQERDKAQQHYEDKLDRDIEMDLTELKRTFRLMYCPNPTVKTCEGEEVKFLSEDEVWELLFKELKPILVLDKLDKGKIEEIVWNCEGLTPEEVSQGYKTWVEKVAQAILDYLKEGK